MGWSFRKSTSFGPFRLNLSKSGLGFSLGVKGARVSVSKRGTYVNLGANGIYYRQKIGGPNSAIPLRPAQDNLADVSHSITTENVDKVTDVDSRAFIDELESKESKISLFKWFGLWPSVILFIYALSFADDVVREEVKQRDLFVINKKSVHIRTEPSKSARSIRIAKLAEQYPVVSNDSSGWVEVSVNEIDSIGFVRADMGYTSRVEQSKATFTRMEDDPALIYGYAFLALALFTLCICFWQVDKKRKTLEIYYTLDHEINELHEKFLAYFGEFASSKKIWQNLHVSGVSNTKYHAGASQLINRTGIKGIARHKRPSPFLKTNVSIPCITLRNTEMFFFPERLIVKRGAKFGAVFYRNISIEKSDVRFIESESVPIDATIIDYTWQYLNKSGGPDRRFNNNRRLPICRYSEYLFRSEGGLNEIITTSRNGAMDNFAGFVEAIGSFQMRLN